MRRREFIALVGGAVMVSPTVADGQGAIPAVGFLNSASPEAFSSYVDGFLLGLNEEGFTINRNVAIEYRWARGRYDQLPSLAAELVTRNVAVIAAAGEPSVKAAGMATSTIPIVFLVGGDPVRLGLVSSFNRPGGNSTGLTMLTTSLDLKRLGLLREALPNAATVAVLINPTFPGSEMRKAEIQGGARSIGQNIFVRDASNEVEIEAAFSDFSRSRPDAVLVAGDPFFNARREQIVSLAGRYALPAIYEWREFAVAGGLMSYGAYLSDVYRQLGAYTGRVLRSGKPADLPVLQPTKFGLVINLRAARNLGLAVPDKLLVAADEVIE